jgi:hypothetical protein
MPNTADINRPGAPTNPPHTAREGTDISEGRPDSLPRARTDGHTAHEGAHRQTGDNTSPDPAESLPPGHDPGVTDPHPSDEEHPYRAKPPGGTNPPKADIGPNPAAHDGTPPPRPDNADNGPKFSPG